MDIALTDLRNCAEMQRPFTDEWSNDVTERSGQ
jgi:hypothetical protein